ncbi:MAG: hypothetical protein ABIF01_02830 [Candidatus Micrarchaeota archaeon]
MKRGIFVAFLISFSFLAYAALIGECEEIATYEKDGCYLAKSRQPDQCMNILDPTMRDQCFILIAESHAKTYGDCDRLYQEYQPICYARISYLEDSNPMACDRAVPEYRSYCYYYYADKRSNGQIMSCGSIPPQYKQDCLTTFFKKASIRSEDDCAVAFGERYSEECRNYVGSKNNPITVSLSFVESAWSFLSSGSTILWGSIVVFLAILIFLLSVVSRAWRTGKEKGG